MNECCKCAADRYQVEWDAFEATLPTPEELMALASGSKEPKQQTKFEQMTELVAPRLKEKWTLLSPAAQHKAYADSYKFCYNSGDDRTETVEENLVGKIKHAFECGNKVALFHPIALSALLTQIVIDKEDSPERDRLLEHKEIFDKARLTKVDFNEIACAITMLDAAVYCRFYYGKRAGTKLLLFADLYVKKTFDELVDVWCRHVYPSSWYWAKFVADAIYGFLNETTEQRRKEF
jgi:hypothetical protein